VTASQQSDIPMLLDLPADAGTPLALPISESTSNQKRSPTPTRAIRAPTMLL
jgi:hypothetical protein